MRFFVEIPLSVGMSEEEQNYVYERLWSRAISTLLQEYGKRLRGITLIHQDEGNSELTSFIAKRAWRAEFEVDIHPSPSEG